MEDIDEAEDDPWIAAQAAKAKIEEKKELTWEDQINESSMDTFMDLHRHLNRCGYNYGQTTMLNFLAINMEDSRDKEHPLIKRMRFLTRRGLLSQDATSGWDQMFFLYNKNHICCVLPDDFNCGRYIDLAATSDAQKNEENKPGRIQCCVFDPFGMAPETNNDFMLYLDSSGFQPRRLNYSAMPTFNEFTTEKEGAPLATVLSRARQTRAARMLFAVKYVVLFAKFFQAQWCPHQIVLYLRQTAVDAPDSTLNSIMKTKRFNSPAGWIKHHLPCKSTMF